MAAALLKQKHGTVAYDDLHAKVYELIKAKSFIRGPKKLSSGLWSDHYFDMKFSMLDPYGAKALAELVLAKLPNIKIDFVGGLELGAVPLISPIALMSAEQGRPIPGLIVRKKAKEHGTQKLIEGAENLQGKVVVVVDDVTTTGDSALKSIRALQQEGAIVALVISIVDREEGATELYKREGIPFDPLFRASEFLNTD